MTSTSRATSDSSPESHLDHGGGSADRIRNPDIPYGLNVAAAWSWRLIVILTMAGVLVYLSRSVSTIITAVLVAALIAGLLSPFVLWLRRRKVGAGIATAIVELGAIIVVLGLLALVGQQMVKGFSELSDQVVSGYHQLMTWLSDGPLQLSVDQVDNAISSVTKAAKDNSSQLLSGAAAAGSTAGEIGTGLLIALFTLIFFLLEGERIWLFLVKLIPRKAQKAVNGAGRRGWHSLVSYTRVQVLVAFVDALGIGIAALILGVPLAFPLGVLVFLSSFIPVIGALFSGVIAVLLALVANGPINALIMLIAVLLVQQIESHILQPLVMGRAVSLHPLAVVLAVALGSTVLGILGALFAVPVLAVVNTVVRYLANRGWEHDENIRTTPFAYQWEIEKREKKSAAQKAKAKLKEAKKSVTDSDSDSEKSTASHGSDAS
ncbi:AI-2E family transporter [uncultured Kocuria sp.]|uniref:AI-2E family transporter n=1 Tax=uncultured Kocuria sp. TaxID=259305 RepID=UPI0025953F78|nr:AI-2E family transporter [uncultured Kocuria sp.]MCT1366472.1 AI-2E family transporter [Rothia sp. p3-SID1597]